MENKKIPRILLALVLLIITVFVSQIYIKLVFGKNQTATTLTQLSAQGSRQMMGYIIKTNNNKIIVIDGGTVEDTQNLINHINNLEGKVDYWFITHAHDDHAGAFTEIVEQTDIQIDNIYVSLNEYSWYEENEESRKEFSKKLIDILNDEEIYNKVKEPKINDVIQIDNIQVEVLGIKNPEITEENAGNEQSMVLKIDTQKNTFLILGDIGIKASEKLIITQKDKLKSDIVQMSHHGQNGATEELYKIINPQVCLWPCPEWLWNNDSGEGVNTGPWKTLETRGWIENLKIKENYVAKDGDITINI